MLLTIIVINVIMCMATSLMYFVVAGSMPSQTPNLLEGVFLSARVNYPASIKERSIVNTTHIISVCSNTV